jgi:hypothetical protein
MIIKKLFCNHKYEYFYKDRYLPLFSDTLYDKWYFICKNCEKIVTLYELDVDKIHKKLLKKVAKEVAMDVDNSKYENYEFILGNSVYKGKVAFYMKQKYKKFHQEETIFNLWWKVNKKMKNLL